MQLVSKGEQQVLREPPVEEGARAVYGYDAQVGKLVRLGFAEYDVHPIDSALIRSGQVYSMRAGVFHLSMPIGQTVTVMEIMEKHDIQPRILVHKAVEPDNAFDRCTAMSEDEVWETIVRYKLEEIIDANGGLLNELG